MAGLATATLVPISAFDLSAASEGFGTPLHAAGPLAARGIGLADGHAKARVLLVDSDEDCLRRFANAVGSDAGLQLLATAANSDDAMACLALHRPDVVVVEPGLSRSFGLALIRHCAMRLPQTDILVRTRVGDDETVLSAIEAGATGYVYRDADAEWIVASIHALRDGGALISPGVARRVLARFRVRVVVSAHSGFGALEALSEMAPTRPTRVSPLSEIDIEILRLVACGTGLHEIGDVLSLPPREVLAQVKGIYRQLAARGRGV